MERAILRGQPFHNKSGYLIYIPAFQNRVLFPALLETGAHIGIFSVNAWYALIRFTTSIFMFAVFWLALRMNAGADQRVAFTGQLLLAYCLIGTFNITLVLTNDFPDAMFTASFVVVALRYNRILFFILAIIAATNRESSAFAGLIWVFLYGIDDNRKINWRESAFGALVSVFSYGVVILLRYVFGGAEAIKSNTQSLDLKTNLYQIVQFAKHPTPFSWAGLICCMTAPCVFWLVMNREFLSLLHMRLILAACAIAAISIFFGNISEPRIFIPSIVIAIFVVVWTEASRRDRPSHQFMAIGR